MKTPALSLAAILATIAALLPSLLADVPTPLRLAATIPLPDVSGRIDHMAFDREHQRMAIAALGNDSVEVVDLAAGNRTRRIAGLREPQGVVYSEKADLLFVANAGDGSVRMFRAADF